MQCLAVVKYSGNVEILIPPNEIAVCSNMLFVTTNTIWPLFATLLSQLIFNTNIRIYMYFHFSFVNLNWYSETEWLINIGYIHSNHGNSYYVVQQTRHINYVYDNISCRIRNSQSKNSELELKLASSYLIFKFQTLSRPVDDKHFASGSVVLTAANSANFDI